MMGSLEEWSTMSTALAVGIVTLLLVKMWQSYRYFTSLRRLGIPGPTPVPLLGNMSTMFTKNLVDVFTTWGEQYGKLYGIYFPTPMLVVGDKNLAREVLIKNFNKVSERMHFPGFDVGVMKDNLLVIRGDHWKHVRSQLSPTFSSNKLRQVFPAITRVAQNLRQHLKEKCDKKEMMELREFCRNVTMDVIAGAAFGLEVDSIKDPSDQFYIHGQSMVDCLNSRAPLFNLFPFLVKLGEPVGYTAFRQPDTEYLVRVIDAALKERRLDREMHGDFLQLLVEAEKAGSEQGPVDADIDFRKELRTSSGWARKGLTMGEMLANSILFLFAGYDTVSTVMSSLLFTLAANPECLKRAQEEINQKLGKDNLSYDGILSLTYLEMCMNETMRLYMPVLSQRMVTEDIEVGGYHVPKGTAITVPAPVFHLDPKEWPDPHKFDPERHTAEERGKRHPFSFMPFGMGPRNCIGMRLAQVEICTVVACILQNYVPVLCEKSVYPPVFKPLSAYARDGLWIRLEERQV